MLVKSVFRMKGFFEMRVLYKAKAANPVAPRIRGPRVAPDVHG
jgi:hypothetical protein